MSDAKLYYVDRIRNEVIEVEETRDRLLSVSPIFYTRRIYALRELERHIERSYYEMLSRLRCVRREMASER
jgi:hypothetical protein